jgi:hypothetical protein
MTSDQEKPPPAPENGAESLPEEPKQRFDPFTNEGDMFKIVLWVGAAVLVVMVLAFLSSAIFGLGS